ncbi:MAG: hypothetical protein HYT70_04750 [Candidatus Aenigmarchaeota archaeon]|nr:hypothetical protein [Candidatus Aenigmarchaeota archaeon]
MGKLAQIFGKESDIRRSDVEKCIIESSLEESINIEYKSLESITKMEQQNIEGNIIKPLVAFLNRIEKESSLLILGIRTNGPKPSHITPIKKELISEEKLRSWITTYTGSIPSYKTFPSFRIIEIGCPPNSESIFLIEINPFEDVLFYSKISDTVYTRRGSESSRLTLSEILSLIESKRYPINMIDVKQKEYRREGDKNHFTFDIIFTNIGASPSTNVTCYLKFNIAKGLEEHVSIRVDKTKFIKDLTELNTSYFKSYAFYLARVMDGHEPMYPAVNYFSESPLVISISDENEIICYSSIYDQKGISNLSFSFSKDGVKLLSNAYVSYIR